MSPSFRQLFPSARSKRKRGVRRAYAVLHDGSAPPSLPTHGDAHALAADEEVASMLAERIRASGMAAPATFLLQVLRPAHWLGGQALHVARPLLESLGIGRRRDSLSPGALALFFEREGSVDALLASLEEPVTKNKGQVDGL